MNRDKLKTNTNGELDADGDDHILVGRLYDAMDDFDESFLDTARFWLRKSKDENLRSTCIEYLVSLDILFVSDILIGLKDKSESVRLASLRALDEPQDSQVIEQLLLMLAIEKEPLLLALVIRTLAESEVMSDRVIEDILKISLGCDDVVKIACYFYLCYLVDDELYGQQILELSTSSDFLTRKFFIEALGYLAETARWEDYLQRIKQISANDDLQLLKELALDQYRYFKDK